MKKQVILLSALALLSLASCGEEKASSSSESSNESISSSQVESSSKESASSSSSVSSSSSEVVEASITINTPEKTTLEIGESLTLTATKVGIADSATIRWASSDATVISISAASGKANALKAGTASITASYGDVVSQALVLTVNEEEVPVPQPVDKKTMVAEVKTKLEAATTYEASNAKNGHFYTETKNTSNVVSRYEKYDFDVYSGNRSVSKHEKKTSATSTYITNERISYTYHNEKLIKAVEDKDGNAYASPTYSLSSLTGEAAITQSNLPYLGKDEKGGFANYILQAYFSGKTYFADGSYAEAKEIDNFSGKKEGNTYTLSVTSLTGTSDTSDKEELNLVLTFNENALIDVSGTMKIYDADYDYDTDKTTYALSGTQTIDGELTTGTRESAPADLFDPASLYATSFEAKFSSGYGSSKVEGTTFGVNTTISITLAELLPATYSSVIDPYSVTFPNNEDKISRSSYGTSFSVTQAIDDLTVVIATKAVSKTYHLKITEKLTTTLKYNNTNTSSAGVINEAITGKVSITSGAVTNITYEVTSDNKATASIEKKSETEFSLTATAAGTYTVKFSDSKSGLSGTKDFYICENNDEGYKLLLANSVKRCSSSTKLKNIAISFDESGKGNISLVASITDEYDDDVDYNLSASFTLSTGVFTLDSSTANPKINSIAFADSTHNQLKIGIYDGLPTTYTVYLQAPAA